MDLSIFHNVAGFFRTNLPMTECALPAFYYPNSKVVRGFHLVLISQPHRVLSPEAIRWTYTVIVWWNVFHKSFRRITTRVVSRSVTVRFQGIVSYMRTGWPILLSNCAAILCMMWWLVVILSARRIGRTGLKPSIEDRRTNLLLWVKSP